MIVAHYNQSGQPSIDLNNSSQPSAATSTQIERKQQQESKLWPKSKSENDKDANN